MNYLSLWLTTSRPLLYPLVPIVILFGYFATGGTILTLSNTDLAILLLFTFPFSLIVYGLNDIHDYESDVRNTTRHWLTGGVALPAVHRAILIGVVLAILTILIALVLIGSQLIALTVSAALVFAYWYSVPPIRLKARPVIDALFSGAGYIIIPFCIGTSLNGVVTVLPEVILMALFVAAYHIFCSVRDIDADRSVGDTTTAVWLGRQTSLVFVALIASLVAVVWFLIRPHDLIALVLFVGLLLAAVFSLRDDSHVRIGVNLMIPLAAVIALTKLLI